MEVVISTRSRNIGLDEGESGIPDIEYFSILPKFKESFGCLSKESVNWLEPLRQRQVDENKIKIFKFKISRMFYKVSKEFTLYEFKTIAPVLYEVLGFNGIINLKELNYNNIEFLYSFFEKGDRFSRANYDNLEKYCNYIVCSYHEGEASMIYTSDSIADDIIQSFKSLCYEKKNVKMNVDELRR